MYQVARNQDAIEFALNKTIGAGKQNVVFKRTSYDFAASAGSGLSVNVTPGSGFANYKLASVLTTTNLPFTAPTVSTRVDLIQLSALTQAVSVKTGVEGGSAPSADTDCIGLWEVTTLVAQATRLSGDLVDVRPF